MSVNQTRALILDLFRLGESRRRFGYTPLMIAVASNLELIVIQLMEMGFDINESGRGGTTPLMASAIHGCVDCMHLLLQSGCDITKRDDEGRTALMVAVGRLGCGPPVGVLIGTGMDLNMQDFKGRTALMHAASQFWYGYCVRQLIEAGADVNLTDCEGRTALGHAAVRQRYVDQEEDDNGEDIEEVIQTLVEAGASINASNNDGRSALIVAAMLGKAEIVETLLSCGADVNWQDNMGQNALMHACVHRNSCHIYDSQSEPNFYLTSELLLDYKSDEGAQDNRSMTALMLAALHNSTDILPLIARSQNDHNMRDNTGRSALVYALMPESGQTIKNCAVTCFSMALQISECGAYQLLPSAHRSVLDECMVHIDPFSKAFKSLNQAVGSRLCLYNGILPQFSKGGSYFLWALQEESCHVDICRYMISNCYVTERELQHLRWSYYTYKEVLDGDKIELVDELLLHPWPLVKLAQVSVTSAIGLEPGREQRILQLDIPTCLKDVLLFRIPMITLPIHHWTDLDRITFDPVVYNTLPGPRPFILNWPLGRELTACTCKRCSYRGGSTIDLSKMNN